MATRDQTFGGLGRTTGTKVEVMIDCCGGRFRGGCKEVEKFEIFGSSELEKFKIGGLGRLPGLGRLIEAAPTWHGWREIAWRISTCRVSRSPASRSCSGGGS